MIHLLWPVFPMIWIEVWKAIFTSGRFSFPPGHDDHSGDSDDMVKGSEILPFKRTA